MKKKILIIEDEKDLKFFLVRKFTEEGFDVEEAIDGEEGIKKPKENKPDLILLDLLLPGIDGFEVLSRLKRDPDLESIPVIILSNLGQEEEIGRGLKLGAVDYLIKANFTLDEIVERVRKVLK
jgi:DNA-binding response OmpR family regulator